MTKKIAIPMENGKLSTHFDIANILRLLMCKTNRLQITKQIPPEHNRAFIRSGLPHLELPM